MPRRLRCVFALLCVLDAITVHGRGPRPVSVSQPEAAEAGRLIRKWAA
ncbi:MULTISPECIES: hypothetical protein [Methylobacterium]|jgi:hypothetical protein|uniref:Uncharacterized protein n=1 Tax=Methylobacterium isbiliense TaxID=315478 RepID=A0ABQ4SAX6_9HYPH|nr:MULTISPECIES: hypothetical protein [Methylobacterium]MBY0299582.1 hypothetical protein [Methylobacterium sp.]MDN3623317.1 hypothetical protein [Methylobacterium isbiliense]GJE00127.1 hypothetical protein GMJLKIPL_2045 [Methylobacterium isbiliense]